MKSIHKKTESKLKPRWKKVLFFLFPGLVFIFLVNLALAPFYKISYYEKLLSADSAFVAQYDATYDHPELMGLAKEKAYKEALLKMAASDSIQLAVNLSDSTVCLFIKGVKIHESKIRTYQPNKVFENMPARQQLKLFSQPLSIKSQYATIVKEPVVVRQAPKDTLEAVQNAWKPDTLIQNTAFLLLKLDHDIDLIFEQEEIISLHDKWQRFIFFNNQRLRYIIDAISGFIRFKKQEYHPGIYIQLPADELRAIYRALPVNAQISLSI